MPFSNSYVKLPEGISHYIPLWEIPSGKLSHNYRKSPFFIGKPSIKVSFSIAMLNYQRVYPIISHYGKYSGFFFHIPTVPTFCPFLSHPLGRSHGGVIEGCRLAADVVRAAVLGHGTTADTGNGGSKRWNVLLKSSFHHETVSFNHDERCLNHEKCSLNREKCWVNHDKLWFHMS